MSEISEGMTVEDGVVVSLDYTLRLDDGEVIDTSSGREPLVFLQGQGQIIPGLEKELYGMGEGDKKEVVVDADEAYGEYDEDQLQEVPRSIFPDNIDLEEGLSLRMRDQESGQLFDAVVDEVKPTSVVLDLNHPLAGETLYFDVEIAGLRAATEQERTHGHVHGPNGADH
jgi:FKBP-type peptidyl-prolyl cis-trans isomerase SlyD